MRGLARWVVIFVAVLFLAGAAAGADSSPEFEAWTAIQQAPTDAAIVDFLVKYPQSPFRQKAAAMLADLRGTSPADILDQYGGSNAPQSTAPQSAAPQSVSAAPGPASKQESPKPVGTFEQSGRKDYKDRSGWWSWEDTLVLNADGTGELTTKYRSTLYSGWYLTGCQSGVRVGTYLWKRQYKVTVNESTVSLQGQAPAEVSRVDPICWEHDSDLGGTKPWVLDWVDGHLSNKDGEYVRRKY